VYDVSGREVVVLVNELEDAGRHIAKWDGHDDAKRRMPAGVYFARLESGGRVEARKVVLAR
jgi:flagellar hook assembly protein FlgD